MFKISNLIESKNLSRKTYLKSTTDLITLLKETAEMGCVPGQYGEISVKYLSPVPYPPV